LVCDVNLLSVLNSELLHTAPPSRDIVEAQLLPVLRTLESATDPDDLAEYCYPPFDGPRYTPIASDIDIAIGEASCEIYEHHPEIQSPEDGLSIMRQMFEP
jgi:hypothetical protein